MSIDPTILGGQASEDEVDRGLAELLRPAVAKSSPPPEGRTWLALMSGTTITVLEPYHVVMARYDEADDDTQVEFTTWHLGTGARLRTSWCKRWIIGITEMQA